MWPFIRPSSISSSLRHRLLHTLVDVTRVTLRSSASENATRLTTAPDSAALFCETLSSPEASSLAPTLFYDVPRRQVFSVNLALGVFRRHSLYAEAAERLLAEKSNRLQIRHVPLGAAVPLPVPLSSAEASALSCHFFHQLGFSDSDRRLFQRNLASRLLAPAFVSAFSLSFSPGIHDEQEQEAPQRGEETPQAEGFKSELVGWEKVNSDQLCETARRLLTGFVEGKRAQETLEEMGLKEAFAPRDGLLGSFLSKAALPFEAIPLIHPPPPLGVEVKGMAEAELPEDYVYRPLVETQQAIELINKLVRDRRFLDAILTLEEWALQELDPASLQPLRKLVTEAMSKDTVLKFWPTLEAKQASLLLEVSTSALLLSEASRLTSIQARRWLDRLRGIDSI
ncbi:MAG: hypothetical protein Q8P67_08215, partial [archaeon]|nr:hypothetical protein [archaeon]